MKKTKEKLSIILYFVIVTILLSNVTLIAQEVSVFPNLIFGKMETTQKDSRLIKGKVIVTNKESYYVGNTTMTTELYKGSDLWNIEYVDKSLHSFEIDPFETKTVSFAHKVTASLDTDNYFMFIRIVNSAGIPIANCVYELGQIEGQGQYLSFFTGDTGIDNRPSNGSQTSTPDLSIKLTAGISKDGEEYAPLEGISFKKGESPKAFITYINKGNSAIKAYPQITVYERDYNFLDEPLIIAKADFSDFNVGKEKRISIDLPAQTKPASYLASVRMINEKNETISGTMEFRWVVEGVSASILSMNGRYNIDTNKIDVNINIVGPADGSEVADASVYIKLYNNNDNTILDEGIKQINLSFTPDNLKMVLTPNTQSQYDLRAECSIIKDGEVLALDSIIIPGESLTKDAATSPEDKEQQEFEKSKETEIKKIPQDILNTKYQAAIEALIEEGIVSGYDDGTYKPNKNITRAEFAKMVVGMMGIEVKESDMYGSQFIDVDEQHWAIGYINVAKNNKLIEGYDTGEFMPDSNISNAECLTLLVRVMGFGKEADSNGDWPHNYINKADELGIMAGAEIREFDNFMLKSTRGDIAIFVFNVFNVIAR